MCKKTWFVCERVLIGLALSFTSVVCASGSDGAPVPPTGFVTRWNTDVAGYYGDKVETARNQIRLPLSSGGTYDFVVSWGDGREDTITEYNQEEVTHTYKIAGEYEVRIIGVCEGFGFDYDSTSSASMGDCAKLLDVSQWGAVKLHNEGYQFNYCIQLSGFSASDTPDLSDITDMNHMFWSARLFNGDIGSWDVSNVTNMNGMFSKARLFNGDIGSWDVSGVTNMSDMFRGTRVFNGDIGSWDVGNVTDMNSMFRDAGSFNRDIGSWDVGNVTDMNHMFRDARLFNRDIGDWDVGNVTDMSSMFWYAESFNQDISGWDVTRKTDHESIFSGCPIARKNKPRSFR